MKHLTLLSCPPIFLRSFMLSSDRNVLNLLGVCIMKCCKVFVYQSKVCQMLLFCQYRKGVFLPRTFWILTMPVIVIVQHEPDLFCSKREAQLQHATAKPGRKVNAHVSSCFHHPYCQQWLPCFTEWLAKREVILLYLVLVKYGQTHTTLDNVCITIF